MSESNDEDATMGSGKIGLAGTLGGIAAIITAVATLLTAYSAYSHSSSDTKDAKPPSHQETATPAPAPAQAKSHPSVKLQDPPPQEVAPEKRVDSAPLISATSISGYWSAIPQGRGRTWVFFFKTLGRKPGTKGNQVSGTIQDPCTNDAPVPFDDGFYDGHALELRIPGFPNGEVYAMVAEVNGDQIEGSASLGRGLAPPVKVVPGAAPCPNR